MCFSILTPASTITFSQFIFSQNDKNFLQASIQQSSHTVKEGWRERKDVEEREREEKERERERVRDRLLAHSHPI